MSTTFWTSMAVVASLLLAFTAGAQAHGGAVGHGGGGGGRGAVGGGARGGGPVGGFRGGNPGMRTAPQRNFNPGMIRQQVQPGRQFAPQNLPNGNFRGQLQRRPDMRQVDPRFMQRDPRLQGNGNRLNQNDRANQGYRGNGGRILVAPVPGGYGGYGGYDNGYGYGYDYPYLDDPNAYNPFLDDPTALIPVPVPAPDPVPDTTQSGYQSPPCNVWQLTGTFNGAPVVATWDPIQSGYFYNDPSTGTAVLVATAPDSCLQ